MKKQVFNPYLPSYEYIPDGEPRVFNDRLYIFGSHDKFGSTFFCDNDYVLWSAPLNDLSDWKNHGIIYRKDQDPLNKDGKYPLFAPDVIKGKDNKYYLYYGPSGTRSIGVAVSDSPYGQYEFLNHIKDKEGNIIGTKDNDPYPFDPAIFIDDDNQIYLYLGFSPDKSWTFLKETFGEIDLISGPCVMKLEDDMYTLKDNIKKVEIINIPDSKHNFLEASSLRKINNIYYFIYSSNSGHELCYGISDNPEGPFEYKGVIHDNGDIGINGITEDNRVNYTANNHGSLVKLNDDYYIFGHRHTNYCVYSRQGIAEKVIINKDGTIDQVELTSYGLNGKPLNNKGKYYAYIACHLTSNKGALQYDGNCDTEEFKNIRDKHPAFSQDGPDRENNPNQYIKNMKDGASCGFKYFEYCDSLNITVETRGDEGLFEIRTSLNGPILGKIYLDKHEEYMESKSIDIKIPDKKEFALYFTYRGNGSIDFNSFTLNN